MDTPRRLFTASLIIGKTSGGKTSLAATFAEYLWETYRRVLLLDSCDGGAVPARVQTRIQQGLIRFWRMRTRSAKGLAFETCYLASKGYFPERIDPVSGETEPGVRLVPPITTLYTLTDKEGHVLTVTQTPAVKPHFCKTCKKMYTPAEIQFTEASKQTPGFEQVGGMFFDGLTSACGWFMEDMDERRGAGDITGGEGTALGKGTIVRSGQQSFGGNNKADYGFAQTRARQLVTNSLSIPNLVEGPVFTALTLEVPDEGNVRIVSGQLVGKAMTDVLPQWFGNVFEAAVVTNADGQKVRRLYLEPYTDDQGRDHLLKNSSSGSLPAYLEDPPKGDRAKMFSQFNLGLVFKLLDEDLRESLKDTPEEMPGLTAAPTQYGAATGEDALPPPSTPVAPAQATPPPAESTPEEAEAVPTRPTAGVPPAPPEPPKPRPIARPIARGRLPQTAPEVPQEQPPAETAPARPSGAVPPPPGMKPPMRAPGA